MECPECGGGDENCPECLGYEWHSDEEAEERAAVAWHVESYAASEALAEEHEENMPEQTKADLEAELLAQMKLILSSNVTTKALQDPDSMTVQDVLANLHLYDRLWRALGSLSQLRGYEHSPRWVADLVDRKTLLDALRYTVQDQLTPLQVERPEWGSQGHAEYGQQLEEYADYLEGSISHLWQKLEAQEE